MNPTPDHATQTILALREELKRERVIKAALLNALRNYTTIFGNTAYQVSRETARDLYNAADAAIAVAEGRKP